MKLGDGVEMSCPFPGGSTVWRDPKLILSVPVSLHFDKDVKDKVVS
jgi:hypothetical protein